MRYKVGAERFQSASPLVHRAEGVFRADRTAPAGPTHAVCAQTGVTACRTDPARLVVLDQDWETNCFLEKCPDCFAAVAASGARGR
jgi:hypothetical protein